MFTGSCVALVTPMTMNGSVDKQNLGHLVKWHIKQGTSALVVAGTTGECATLSHEELVEVIRCVVQAASGKIPVIAGTGSYSTRTTIENTQLAKDLGCHAALVVTPFYNRPTQEGLYQHYKALNDAIDFPIILYNVPARTACDLLPETVARLSKLKNIIGIKEATGDLSRIAVLTESCPIPFRLYSGDDSSALDFMQKGGHGVISVAANVVPNLVQSLCQASFNGKTEQAIALNDKLKNLYKKLALESNPIPVKWALKEMGFIQEGIRLPLTALSVSYRNEMRETLKVLGVINA